MPKPDIEKFLAELSTETLLTRLDHESIQDRYPAKWQLFERYATASARTAEKVWNRKQFAHFLSHRLLADKALIALLWRRLYFQAREPLADPLAASDDQEIDLAGFIRALRTNVYHQPIYFGQRRHDDEKVKLWDYFFGMSAPTERQYAHEDALLIPPDRLDRISYHIQARLRRTKIVPNLQRIRPHAQEVFGACPSIRCQDFGVTYDEMLALFTAILAVKVPASKMHLDHSGTRLPPLGSVDDHKAREAVASAILSAGEVHKGAVVTFTSFWHSSRFFVKHDGEAWHTHRDIEDELDGFWYALFDVSVSDLVTEAERFHNLLSRSLRSLSPYLGRQDAEDILGATMSYQSTAEEMLDNIKGLFDAFSGLFYAKIAGIKGVTVLSPATSDKCEPRIAIFAIITPAPHLNGDLDILSDHLIGDQHYLLEIAPRLRILQHKKTDAVYEDLVSLQKDRISVGDETSSAGLTISVDSVLGPIAELWSDGSQGDYAIVPVDQESVVAGPSDEDAFQTKMRITEICICDLPGFTVLDREEIERSTPPC